MLVFYDHERSGTDKQMKAFLQLCLFISTLALVLPVSAAECTGAAVSTPVTPQIEFLRAYHHDFSSPVRLALDGSGAVYIADPQKGEVLVRAPDGRVLQHRRNLGRPGAIAVDDANNIYLADLDSGLIRVFDAGWQFSHQFAGAVMQQAGDITIDATRSRIYISDSEAHLVRVYSLAGEPLFEFGTRGDGDGQFQYPSGVFFDSVNDELLVSDQLGYRLQVFDPDGVYKYCIGGSSANPGGIFQGGRLLAAPQGLWVDASGRIYVADSFEGQVKVIDRNGLLLTTVGTFGQAGGELRIPADVVVDNTGRLFVASANNARVEMFGIDGFSDPELYTPALLSIEPVRVPADSSGVLTAVFSVPGLRLSDVHNDSIRLNGLPPLSLQTVDVNRDAEPELQASFDLGSLLETLPPFGTAQLQLQATSQTLTVDGAASIEIIATDLDQDQDRDGVDDDLDQCPDTAAGAVVDAVGCALAQYCACGDFNKHGAYMKCIVKTSRRFVDDGLMDRQDRKQAIRTAARGDCGKGRGHTGRRDDKHEDDNDHREKARDESNNDDSEQDDRRAGGGRYRR